MLNNISWVPGSAKLVPPACNHWVSELSPAQIVTIARAEKLVVHVEFDVHTVFDADVISPNGCMYRLVPFLSVSQFDRIFRIGVRLHSGLVFSSRLLCDTNINFIRNKLLKL